MESEDIVARSCDPKTAFMGAVRLKSALRGASEAFLVQRVMSLGIVLIVDYQHPQKRKNGFQNKR
jgi:hypothetical protein